MKGLSLGERRDSAGRSGGEVGEQKDGDRLDVPSLGERTFLLGGIGGLDWGLGCGSGEAWPPGPTGDPRGWGPWPGLGQLKTGLAGSLRAVGPK